jgi:hypothetical protein
MVDVKYGLPVVAEDIEAHVAFEVDVWVIYLLGSSSTQAGLRKIRRTHTFVSQSTFGGWCGYCDGILNRNGYVPPFQNPSSGLSVMVKVNKSSFPFGKLIDVVGLRLSSCISACREKSADVDTLSEARPASSIISRWCLAAASHAHGSHP